MQAHAQAGVQAVRRRHIVRHQVESPPITKGTWSYQDVVPSRRGHGACAGVAIPIDVPIDIPTGLPIDVHIDIPIDIPTGFPIDVHIDIPKQDWCHGEIHGPHWHGIPARPILPRPS